jgi:hypothetical protein
MKDTLKMQGVTRPVVGIKKLIDYYNENYTRKKECICKDLRPTRMLDVDEYFNFVNDGNEATPLLEKPYFPLFKTPKIINNISEGIFYILKINNKEYNGVMKNAQENKYIGDSAMIAIKGDELVLNTLDVSLMTEACSLTLYTYSPELPKLEYPKNKMDMYRAYNFISTIVNSIEDYSLRGYIEDIELPYPNNIDEINLYFDEIWHCDDFNLRKNAYFINPNKDNYYTVLDAIKKGKIVYKNLDVPLVNWEINKEEKWIKFNRNIAIVNETGWVDLEN